MQCLDTLNGQVKALQKAAVLQICFQFEKSAYLEMGSPNHFYCLGYHVIHTDSLWSLMLMEIVLGTNAERIRSCIFMCGIFSFPDSAISVIPI